MSPANLGRLQLLTPSVKRQGSDGVECAMIGHAELKDTLLEKVSSLVQGFGGGLLVLQVIPDPVASTTVQTERMGGVDKNIA